MVFDPQSLLDQTVEGELSTRTDPLPPDDYIARVDKLEIRKLEGKDGKEDRMILTVFWAITETDKLMALDPPRENFTCRQDVWLDVTPAGTIDTGRGKNVSLGRLYEALGLNEGNRTLRAIQGNVAVIRTGIRTSKDNPEDQFTEVKAVSALE